MSNSDANKIIEFLELVGRLKHIQRTGWILRHVNNPESIAGHMYRMGILSFLIDEKDGLDKDKCIKMSLVHDLGECIVGDLTPHCGIPAAEKHRRETLAMRELASLAGNAGTEMFNLYKEYEEQKTPEAKFVKELDRFDMVLQAFEYEKSEKRPHGLQDFFDSTEDKFSHPKVLTLVDELKKQRSVFETLNQQTDK
ncbi:5'-deoxynucleotidase HDDC2 [Schistocerca nitens]|uniref:5'-deoxynucleotidase HDDC2 n=1 Tax=Schistocerca nitens TaxID=7011 RepID=UPI002118769D|nr:5'-deoxynucleotidase HDDC2 [Schistocerca nitens]